MDEVIYPGLNVGANSYKPRILSLRKRTEVYNEWLKNRLDNLLPKLMEESGIELWVVIAREYNEDPVILSLIPKPNLYARRRTILIFHKQDEKVDRLTVYKYGMQGFYESVWDPQKEEQYECVARIIKERNPENIGINVSETWAFGDGLTHSEYSNLVNSLGDMSERLTSAEKLCVRWLETRSEEELESYPMLVELTHAIIKEAFSSKVITPGITSTEDVQWWMRQKILDLGLEAWFPATVDLQGPDSIRTGPLDKTGRKIIKRGDVLHCDIGFYYLGLATDVQQIAYVLKHGETNAPKSIKDAFADANKLQDHHAKAMKTGRTGNEILKIAKESSAADGIKGSIYTHPIGVHGHAAGPIIGLWDKQEGVPGRGDYKLHKNTCYAIELNAKRAIPEWDDQEVTIGLEQDAWWTGEKLIFLAGRQKKIHLIS
jgi:Xaa-Pro aminopeptidase